MLDAHENFNMHELMQITVPQERVDRLKDLLVFDTDEPISDAVKEYLIRQQLKYVNIQYARFLAGIHFTQEEVDNLLQGSIDIHAHGGSEPFERICMEDDMLKDFAGAGCARQLLKLGIRLQPAGMRSCSARLTSGPRKEDLIRSKSLEESR